MTFTHIKFVFSITGCCLLLACNEKPKEAIDKVVPGPPSPVVISAPALVNQSSYYYEPVVSIISGTITTERFYGAPGFGEDPKNDSKENAYVLLLDAPIEVKAEEQAADEFNVTRDNVLKIQLTASQGIRFSDYKDKAVELRGTLFGAHTGHHHTEVLMDVQEINE